MDAHLKRHQEAHSADLLKLHFEKERRLDLQGKDLKRKEAEQETKRVEKEKTNRNKYDFLSSFKGKETTRQAVKGAASTVQVQQSRGKTTAGQRAKNSKLNCKKAVEPAVVPAQLPIEK